MYILDITFKKKKKKKRNVPSIQFFYFCEAYIVTLVDPNITLRFPQKNHHHSKSNT